MKADLIIKNGKCILMNHNKDIVHWIAVKDGKIIDIGYGEEYKSLIDINTVIKDAGGNSVIPGFIDSHFHVVLTALNIASIDLSRVKSFDEIGKASDPVINILVAGVQNSGKSTFINALIGDDILPVDEGIETANIYTLESSDKNYISLKLDDNEICNITVNEKGIEYRTQVNEIIDCIDSLNHDEEFIAAACEEKRLAIIIKKVNSLCKKQQENNEAVCFNKAIIGISKLTNWNESYKISITDVPGSGAAYFNEKHSKILLDAASDVLNAIIIFVLGPDEFAHDEIRKTLKNMIYSKNGEENKQVDFERSI